ncbi:unnamed protein product [Orchesella dallaii]|uniref:Coatomer subunit alpha n=1 Tax=Orchesella dallaii TaxID=48710 RepID=A0ABP1RIE6_9HEXA
MSHVALLAKRIITLCNRKLEILAQFQENMPVKSGAWDDTLMVFIYTTKNQLKYALTSGDNGIIRTLEIPLYITKVKDHQVFCLDREVKVRVLGINPLEYRFKLALVNRNYDEVLRIVRDSNLVGQAMISYLQKKGFPEIALHFVKEEKTRFVLALECANIQVALESAKALDDEACWDKLGEMALLLGNHQIVELCYQRTKNYAKLTFLYTITGNLDKLQKLLKIAMIRKDVSSQFNTALLLGDVKERVRILKNGGKTSLACFTAINHGLNEEAEELRKMMSKEQLQNLEKIQSSDAKLLCPPPPLFSLQENWPLLTVTKSVFESAQLKTKIKGSDATALLSDDAMKIKWMDADPTGAWKDDDLHLDVSNQEQNETKQEITSDGEGDAGCGWYVEDDIIELVPDEPELENEEIIFEIVMKGLSVPEEWTKSSKLVIDHVYAGNFEGATRLLHDQIGVVNLEPFRQLFLALYLKSKVSFTALPNVPALPFYPIRGGKVLAPAVGKPLEDLVKKLKGCFESTTKGDFPCAVEKFRSLLLNIPVVFIDDKSDLSFVQELVILCREYILGLQMELIRKDLPKDGIEYQVRSCELAAYFTHCSMDPVHRILTLRTAMNLSFKLKNYKSASSFAKRLLELGPKTEMAQQTKKILQLSEKNPVDEHPMEYHEHNPFSVCATTYKPIYRGKEEMKCPFCRATYLPQFKGDLCSICTVAEVGKEDVSGLCISPIQLR